MIKNKFKFLFIIFLSLFFFHFEKVNAFSSLIFDNSDISDFFSTSFIDKDSNISFNLSKILDDIIVNYQDTHHFAILLHHKYDHELSFYIYVFANDTGSVSIKDSGPEWYTLWLSSEPGYYREFTITFNNFSYSSFMTQVSNVFSHELDNSWDIMNTFDFSSGNPINVVKPYYTNTTITFDKTVNNLAIDVIRSDNSTFHFEKGETLDFLFDTYVSSISSDFPRPKFYLGEPVVENGIVVAANMYIDYEFMDSKFIYQYSFDNKNSWGVYSDFNSQYFYFTVSSNSYLYARVYYPFLEMYHNTVSFNVDFIGKSEEYYRKRMQDIMERDFYGDEPILSLNSKPEDLVKYWIFHLKKQFPIFFQIGQLLTLIQSSSSSSCVNSSLLPCNHDFVINLSSLGINKSFSIINFDLFSQYRDKIFIFIEFIVGFYTFSKLVDIVRKASDK